MPKGQPSAKPIKVSGKATKAKGSTAGKGPANHVAVPNKRQERQERLQLRKTRHRERATAHLTDSQDKEFTEQMRRLGCQIRFIVGDGNCLFRALADQITGRQSDHTEIRAKVVGYIEEQRELFEAFMEDDEPFGDYVERMRGGGEWGGHQELYAAAQHFGVHIIVHQLMAPRFELRSDRPTVAASAVHLSYHGENHYNSVRALDDHSAAPARPIPLPSAAVVSTSGLASTGAAADASPGSPAATAVADAGKQDGRKAAEKRRGRRGEAPAPARFLAGAGESCNEVAGEEKAQEGGSDGNGFGGGDGGGDGGGGGGGSGKGVSKDRGDESVPGDESAGAEAANGDDAADSDGARADMESDAPSPRSRGNGGRTTRGLATTSSRQPEKGQPAATSGRCSGSGSSGKARVARAADCPCKSGRRYKECCRKRDQAAARSAGFGKGRTDSAAGVAAVCDDLGALLI